MLQTQRCSDELRCMQTWFFNPKAQQISNSAPSSFAYSTHIFSLGARRESTNLTATLYGAHEVVWNCVLTEVGYMLSCISFLDFCEAKHVII